MPDHVSPGSRMTSTHLAGAKERTWIWRGVPFSWPSWTWCLAYQDPESPQATTISNLMYFPIWRFDIFHFLLGRKAMTNLDSILKSRDIILLTKVHVVKVMVFPIVMYWCESWTIKKAECQRIDAFELWCLEKTLESPLDSKEIKPVNPKGSQPWIFIGRTDVEAEALILWPRNAKCQLIGKDSDAGKDWGQEEMGATWDEMVGWHHQFNGHEFEQALGESEGQGSLACCSPWGHKESDMT